MTRSEMVKIKLRVFCGLLGFLSVKPKSEKFIFEIKATAEGDYLEGLNILLIPME